MRSPADSAISRLLELGSLVWPGQSERPVTQTDWDAFEKTPEGVPVLLRSEVDAYRAAVGSDWDVDLMGGGLSPTGLRHLSSYTLQCERSEQQSALPLAVASLLSEHAPDGAELAVELGCSVGAHIGTIAQHAKVALGIDSSIVPLRWLAKRLAGEDVAVVRRLVGQRYRADPLDAQPAPDNVVVLAGNALDPPLQAYCADIIVALNLLDNVSEPLNLLAQMDALLRPGGLLILGTPFHWTDSITPVHQQLTTLYPELEGPEAVKHVWRGGDERLSEIRLEVLSEQTVPWVVRDHERCHVHYDVWLTAARKPLESRSSSGREDSPSGSTS